MSLPDRFSLLVLGQGTTGLDIVRWALAHGSDRVTGVTVYGGATSTPTDATRALEAAGATFVYGTEDIEGSFDVCVTSPGISEFSDFFASARAHAAQVMGEPEFAYRLTPERWIGITGTNGKTTTTALTNHLLHAAGMVSSAVGNIGDTAISRVGERGADEWFVAELSSYQLATTEELHPRVAILLNITPDHLSWHRSHENYARAKCRLFQNLGEQDLAVVDVEDEGVCEHLGLIEAPGRRVLSLSVTDPGTPDAAFVRDGVLTVRLGGEETPLVSADELKIAGHHNVVNALAAATAALFVGAAPEGVREGLRSFEPLEHRIEPCGSIDGVRFVNDSKATNTDAVVKALTAFPHDRVVLLVGGHDKGTPLEEFARAVVRSTVASVVCFGEARSRFLQAFLDADDTHELEVAEAENLRDAVDVARNLAERGDVVLLSPACSSFDEFSGFEERGRAFKAYLDEIRAAASDER
ncbi:UDP-N-acetylmuramoyl-L-alanine--D-glutamate ligase [Collinsella sp. An2]|uniref:UDP-N-acetylmuramoyl-L-alanine--D-glutamate ligase n=1 Tax=Collinsella sp. An2 TaxID=1965585 RepID=UPI000B3A38C4|nr:UDP-N-acetylmuramoyl-L-alanine--D-glutamate ligase [Collinsella sp. An2]OUP08654.1 UDP-N-acetylmuramoyl-L-alanine--D-glutamate ligase [Collinsella sp. An2]